MTAEHVLFVDLENVQKLDLSLVPQDMRVMIFCGATQKKLPTDLVMQMQPLGARLTLKPISGQGRNALDFHIAFYLGREVERNPKTACVVLSGDTGFDPLIKHLRSEGFRCRRVTSMKDAFAAQENTAVSKPDEFTRLIMHLKNGKARPAKRKGLAGTVKSLFPKLAEDARATLVQRLFDESYVRETDKALSYKL